ncbi:hypothetical protein [Desertibaculum subflavum]|uniref:hypothetical protein n=1 Tax=Desertibaculum subflavum TaxID=2268458 RepID=UPI0013C49925
MSEDHIPRKRSLAEWSYLYRREHVLRAVRHPALTPAAKQVLVALSVAVDDPFILPERPPVRALARHLALAERTVRQAIAELVEQLCLTLRPNGHFFRPGEGPPADPAGQPELAREWAFLSAARAEPSPAEYLDMLASLRDRAIAAKRIATAVSAERALGRALLAGEQMRREPAEPPEDEAPLGAPEAANLVLVSKVNADRALAPAARHALIEVMLDRANDPVDFPEDDRDKSWAFRISRRHGITVRGARKALAELEDLRLIAQANGDVCVYESRIEERMRRGTDAPSRLPLCEGLDPLQAHRHRLERLRDLALEQGLVSTALSAHKAIGRVLGFGGAKRNARAAPEPKPAPRPTAPPAVHPQFLPVIRNILDIDPGAGRVMLDVLKQIRAEETALLVSAAE